MLTFLLFLRNRIQDSQSYETQDFTKASNGFITIYSQSLENFFIVLLNRNSPNVGLYEAVNSDQHVISALLRHLRPGLGNGEDGPIDQLGVGHDVHVLALHRPRSLSLLRALGEQLGLVEMFGCSLDQHF